MNGTAQSSLLPRAEAQPDVTISAWTLGGGGMSVGGCQKAKAPDATFPDADLAQAPREAQAWLRVSGDFEELQIPDSSNFKSKNYCTWKDF